MRLIPITRKHECCCRPYKFNCNTNVHLFFERSPGDFFMTRKFMFYKLKCSYVKHETKCSFTEVSLFRHNFLRLSQFFRIVFGNKSSHGLRGWLEMLLTVGKQLVSCKLCQFRPEFSKVCLQHHAAPSSRCTQIAVKLIRMRRVVTSREVKYFEAIEKLFLLIYKTDLEFYIFITL